MGVFDIQGKVCVLVAHPDDEAMFFTPVIKYMCGESGSQVYVLCLTNGRCG